jgi:hypothetical protein
MDDPNAAGGERKLDDTVEMPAVDDDGEPVPGQLALWSDGPGDLQA